MWQYNYTPKPDELYHHGIKGMKWGVRRTEAQLARARKKAIKNEPDHEDYKNAHSGRSYRAMSNQELQDVNKRLNMEKQYKDLTKKTSKGKKVVNGFIKTAGTITAVTAAAKTYEKYGKIILDKVGDYVTKKDPVG